MEKNYKRTPGGIKRGVVSHTTGGKKPSKWLAFLTGEKTYFTSDDIKEDRKRGKSRSAVIIGGV